MNEYSRELTSREKRKIRKLVSNECANYDPEYGCLPLEADCYVLHRLYRQQALQVF